jgi:hypothetical protein
MPFNNIGFYAKRRGLGGVGGVTPAPSRNLVITPTLTNNAETISYTATSNMPAGTVLNFLITNLSNTDFTDGTVSGNVTLNSSGGFTLTRNIDRLANYSNTNVVFNLQVINPASSVVLGQSANAVVKPAAPFVATGGNVTTVNTIFTVHTFTNTGNSNLTVSSLGDFPGNLSLRSLVVSGGGAGAPGSSYKESIFGVITNYTVVGGPGGPSGRATDSNVAASTLTVGNVRVAVGTGGTANVGSTPSSFNNVIPTGNTISGASATFTESPSPYNRSETAGGGGFGAGGNGGNGVATSLTNVRGGVGGIGITSDITGTSITYACGGGGGDPESGGGRGCTGAGNGGGNGSNGESATANTGSGGGGGGSPTLNSIPDNTTVFSQGGNGGSGIVALRYLTRYRNMALT